MHRTPPERRVFLAWAESFILKHSCLSCTLVVGKQRKLQISAFLLPPPSPPTNPPCPFFILINFLQFQIFKLPKKHIFSFLCRTPNLASTFSLTIFHFVPRNLQTQSCKYSNYCATPGSKAQLLHKLTPARWGDAGENILKKVSRGEHPVISIVVAQPHEPLWSPCFSPIAPELPDLAVYSGLQELQRPRNALAEHWKVSFPLCFNPI